MSPLSKVNDEQIAVITEMLARPMTQTAIAREFNVSVTLINRIKRRLERGVAPRKNPRMQLHHNLFAHCDQSGGPDSCWNWLRSTNKGGYGHIWHNKKVREAHRVAFEITNGDIGLGPNGRSLVVRHKCDNPSCVNPAHLTTGTVHDNVLDREERKRGRQPKGEDSHFSILLTKDVIFIRRCKDIYNTTEMAKMLGVKPDIIAKILRGESWSHVADLPMGRAAVERHAFDG